MQTYISILRGINVSGHKLIKMKSLQEMFDGLGLLNARTYIQSGNVVFGSNFAGHGELEKIIGGEILKCFGFEVPVIVIGGGELKTISANNPFINPRGEDEAKLHVTFLSAEPDRTLVETIAKDAYSPDEYCVIGKAVYLFCPQGYGNTKLSNTFFEKKLKVSATTRNWKTILELVKLSS
ncbi:MAG: DUF1697 domain-containing protein [Bacteroidetes bacterium]|nr:DUF1697 domain-containing protein [Bacteroidota bacterium]